MKKRLKEWGTRAAQEERERLKDWAEDASEARRNGRHAEAKELWSKIVPRAFKLGERRMNIRALSGCAQAERDMGNNAAAIGHYEIAVMLCREVGDALLLAHTVRHLGDVLRHEKRLPEAEVCYEEALAIYRRESGAAPLDFANALRPMALLQEMMGEDARGYWEEAREMYCKAGVEAGVKEAEKHLTHRES